MVQSGITRRPTPKRNAFRLIRVWGVTACLVMCLVLGMIALRLRRMGILLGHTINADVLRRASEKTDRLKATKVRVNGRPTVKNPEVL